ncbi:MAG: hypothetical protein K9L74_02650 [Candidatus Izimaplasma sp.]|nr:hypothetical protein [Candidatus Izimaplasma bacterium]
MAILGIISLIGLFFLFFWQFGDLERLKNGGSHPFETDYYKVGSFSKNMNVTPKQKEIFDYVSKAKHATQEQIEFACDCTQDDLDELVYLSVLDYIIVDTQVEQTKSIVKSVVSVLGIALIFYFANYYLLVKLNLRYIGIIIYMALFVIMTLNYVLKSLNKSAKLSLKVFSITTGFVIFIIFFYMIFGGRVFLHSDAYSKLIDVSEEEFGTDVKTVDVNNLPIVDKAFGAKLGSLKLGEYPGLGSEFEIGEYSDIIYNDQQYLVAPLEFRGMFKWINNRKSGTPGYILVNKVTKETTLINLQAAEGIGMIYTPSAYFNSDLTRHAYLNGMNRYNLEYTFFEIDESGHPHYILQYSLPTIFINGGKDITKIAVVDAVTGEMNVYEPGNIPDWIESVYPPQLLLEQLNYWGRLQDGFLNSIFTQRDVLQTSRGKRTIMNDGELFYFTGLTSAGADESTIGFVYMNTRTKESRLFKFPGATEQAAMSKVLTLLPQNNISTTFPIPINVNETPTYFIAIKGEDGRILRHVFMNVRELEVYGIAETKNRAHTDYLLSLGANDSDSLTEITGTITDLESYVSESNTIYWIQIDNDLYYILNISTVNIEEIEVFISKEIGDTISFKVQDKTIIKINLE